MTNNKLKAHGDAPNLTGVTSREEKRKIVREWLRRNYELHREELDNQTKRVQEIAATMTDNKMMAYGYDPDAIRRMDQEMLDRYDRGQAPGDICGIECSIEEYMERIRKRLAKNDY